MADACGKNFYSRIHGKCLIQHINSNIHTEQKDSDDKIGRNGLLKYFVRLCSREMVCDKAGIRSTLPDRDWSIRAAF